MVLGCGFDIKKLPIKLPKFYEECFQVFAEHSAATAVSVQCLNNNTIADTIVWNNKHICVDKKSVFHRSLFKKGIITLEDLVNESSDLHVVVKQFSNNSHFTPTELFLLTQVINALPLQWRNSLALHGQKSDKTFVLKDHIKLRLKDQEVSIDEAASKEIYGEILSKYETTPTAQAKYTEQYSNVGLEWKEIYNLPFKVLKDTKSREFQYKILHRYLTTNAFLHKIGLIASPLCTFCDAERESLEQLLIPCPFTNDFWLDFICWCRNVNIALHGLSKIDKLFGIWNREEDFLLLNHLLIVAKKYIYECRKNSTRPSSRVFCKTLAYVYQLESQVMKSNNRVQS